MLFLLAQVSLRAQTCTLSVEVRGFKQLEGVIQLGLFSNEESFLETGSEFRTAEVAVDSSTTIIVLEGLPYGQYAISLYHDQDSDGCIDKNFLGIPAEPYGISNDAWHRFSAPKWDEAAFVLKSDTTIVINLRH